MILQKSLYSFMGSVHSLQRIYGFIGAVPGLLETSTKSFNLEKINLDKNYRFMNNKEMLLLDFNIRRNAENPRFPEIQSVAKLKLMVLPDQEGEAIQIIELCKEFNANNQAHTTAILVKQRGKNVEKIMMKLRDSGINYFYGLFTDEDAEYISFHKECLIEFIELIKVRKRINKNLSKEHINRIKKKFLSSTSLTMQSLLVLIDIFWDRLFLEFAFLEDEEKINFVVDNFENFSLKQYIEFTDAKVTISTVHSAKGLEWDNVILPDMEQNSFPGYYGLCKACLNQVDCNLEIIDSNEDAFLEELSVFYVAVTRARRQVYFTASKLQLDGYENSRKKNLSCFMKLKGIGVFPLKTENQIMYRNSYDKG